MKQQFTDEELTAYLDGEQDPADTRALLQALDSDADLKARLDALRIPDMTDIRASFSLNQLQAPEMPAHLLAAPTRSGSLLRVGLIAASLLGAFWLGAAVNTNLNANTQQAEWITAIAAYQTLYVPATLAAPRQDSALTTRTLKDAQQSLGVDLTNALDLPGLTFKRAQMLGFAGNPLLQIAYVTKSGAPMALCLTKVTSGEMPMQDVTSHDIDGTAWTKNGVGYYLVGASTASERAEITQALEQLL